MRVICIKQRWITVQSPTGLPVQLPKYGKVYTVDKMHYFQLWSTWGITLKELEPEQFYELGAFRPIDASFPEWVEATIGEQVEFDLAIKQLEMP